MSVHLHIECERNPPLNKMLLRDKDGMLLSRSTRKHCLACSWGTQFWRTLKCSFKGQLHNPTFS